MTFNLIDKISDLDKTRINNYINLYGVSKDFIGLDAWLKSWSDNKVKLYKLLGNQFIYKTPFECKKDEAILRAEYDKLLVEFRSFKKNLEEVCQEYIEDHIKCDDKTSFQSRSFYNIIDDLFWSRTFYKDTIGKDFSYKLNGMKRILQIKKEMKPIRVFSKVLEYWEKSNYIPKDIMAELLSTFETFRIKHSIINNDKMLKGDICVSIHPLDFMTMSDNNSNWQSCMNWRNNGCYHIGTVEMMNSNNVICCYIENTKEDFYFNGERGGSQTEEYLWNNKRWRQLVYITKDIIVTGKSYPYQNDDLSKIVVNIVRELAQRNLKWNYQFGPELYQDMKRVYTLHDFDVIRSYIKTKTTKKHNIIFDSNGMYNDMVNDKSNIYWCVRNKVNHNKIISYSGKAPCLCCGNSVIRKDEFESYYNDRYSDTDTIVCQDCLENFRCAFCGERESYSKHYLFNEKKICKNCFNRFFKICPDCGKVIVIGNEYDISENYKSFYPNEAFIKCSNDDFNERQLRSARSFWEEAVAYPSDYTTIEDFTSKLSDLIPIYKCTDCLEKDPDFEKKEYEMKISFWNDKTRKVTMYVTKDLIKKSDLSNSKYKNSFLFNLKKYKAPEA